MDVKYYKNCGNLPIYNFQRILETNNYAYLVFEWDEYEDVSIDQESCEKLWSDIYNEYCKVSKDNSSLMYYKVYSEVIYLETRYHIVSTLLGIMTDGTVLHDKKLREVYIDALSRWDYRIDDKKPILEELERMYQELNFSKNKIGLKKDELKQYNIDDEEKMSFIDQVVRLEHALDKNNIDVHKTSVLKWIAMLQQLKEINNLRRKRAS